MANNKIEQLFFGGSEAQTNQYRSDIAQSTPAEFINEFFAKVSDNLVSVVATLAALAVVILAFRMLFAAGDKEKAQKALFGIAYIFIGVLIIVLAVTLVSIIINAPDSLLT